MNGSPVGLSVALALCIRRVDPLYNIIPCPYGHPAARAVLFVKLIEKRKVYTTAFGSLISPQIWLATMEQATTGWWWKSSVIRRTTNEVLYLFTHSYVFTVPFLSSPQNCKSLILSCLQTGKLKRIGIHMSTLNRWHLTRNYNTGTTVPDQTTPQSCSVPLSSALRSATKRW